MYWKIFLFLWVGCSWKEWKYSLWVSTQYWASLPFYLKWYIYQHEPRGHHSYARFCYVHARDHLRAVQVESGIIHDKIWGWIYILNQWIWLVGIRCEVFSELMRFFVVNYCHILSISLSFTDHFVTTKSWKMPHRMSTFFFYSQDILESNLPPCMSQEKFPLVWTHFFFILMTYLSQTWVLYSGLSYLAVFSRTEIFSSCLGGFTPRVRDRCNSFGIVCDSDRCTDLNFVM